MWSERATRTGALLAGLLLSACSGDGGSGAGSFGSVGTGGGRDAGAAEDPPPAERPSGSDPPDNEILADDASYLCGYDDEDALVWDGSTRWGEVAVANDGRGFAVVHHDAEGALFIEALPVGGEAREPVRLMNAEDAAGAVALAAVQERFLMVWRAGDRLLARGLEGDPTREPVTLSSNLADPIDDGEAFALLGQPERFVAAWIEGDSVQLITLDADGTPEGSAVTLTTAEPPRDLQLGRLDDGRTLLAWNARDADGDGRVMAQVLDAALGAIGDPVQVNDNPVADARFDVGARRFSAGVLYHAREGGVRDTVKYRRIDPEGLPSQPVLNIVNAPGLARDGSIAAFGQGYAVAYRALPSLGVDRPTLRLAFVNQFGRIVHEAELGETSEGGGRTSVSATAGSQLLVSWTTEWPSGARTHAVQLDCPGALLLCGGAVE